jgi:hypothetical protein
MTMNIGLKDPFSGRSLETTPHHTDAPAEGCDLCWGQRVDIFADADRRLCQRGSDAETIAETSTAKKQRTSDSASLLKNLPSSEKLFVHMSPSWKLMTTHWNRSSQRNAQNN